MLGIGPLELILVPDLGSSLGRGMRELKEAVTGADRDELANADVPDARQP